MNPRTSIFFILGVKFCLFAGCEATNSGVADSGLLRSLSHSEILEVSERYASLIKQWQKPIADPNVVFFEEDVLVEVFISMESMKSEDPLEIQSLLITVSPKHDSISSEGGAHKKRLSLLREAFNPVEKREPGMSDDETER
jgi:hypothetical protein